MQCLAVIFQRARLGEDDLGLGQQVGQRCAQFVGDIRAEGRQALERVIQARQHSVDGLGQFRQFHRHLLLG